MIVGCQNQLIERVLQDAERWKRVAAHAPAKPAILYPRPTVFSAHPLIRIHRKAAEVIDALTNEAVLELAWEDHGFRGPRGIIGNARTQLPQSRLIDRIDAALPDAPATMARRDRLTAQDLSCLSRIFSEHRNAVTAGHAPYAPNPSRRYTAPRMLE